VGWHAWLSDWAGSWQLAAAGEQLHVPGVYCSVFVSVSNLFSSDYIVFDFEQIKSFNGTRCGVFVVPAARHDIHPTCNCNLCLHSNPRAPPVLAHFLDEFCDRMPLILDLLNVAFQRLDILVLKVPLNTDQPTNQRTVRMAVTTGLPACRLPSNTWGGRLTNTATVLVARVFEAYIPVHTYCWSS